jgi:thioester reductase-like protein
MTVLLTGATGMVGAEVLAQLLERTDDEVVLVLRARDDAEARDRADELVARTLGLGAETGARDRVNAVAGDVGRRRLGLGAAARDAVLGSVDAIVHGAASIAFDLPLADARAVNVGGTHAVLELARDLHARGRLRRLVHISTAYVSGDHAGTFREDDRWIGQGFRNTYEQSKLEAELLLERCAQELPLVIVRPSIVVGDARSGWTARFHGLYGPLRAVVRGLLPRVAASPGGVVDTVPLDYVAASIVHLLGDTEVRGTLALAAGPQAVTVEQLVGLISAATGTAPPELVDASDGPGGRAGVLVPYFDVRTRFDTRRATEVLGPAGLRATGIDRSLGALLRYASTAAWGRSPTDRRTAARARLVAI